ncbi:MAG: cupin domain-containing protein [Gammaproteobacteria bacterium]
MDRALNDVSLLPWRAADGPPEAARVSAKMAALGYAVTCYTYPPGADFPPHAHAFDKCSSVLAGHFEVTVGRRTWLLAPGDLLFIAAGVTHAARVVGSAAVTSLDGVRR